MDIWRNHYRELAEAVQRDMQVADQLAGRYITRNGRVMTETEVEELPAVSYEN